MNLIDLPSCPVSQHRAGEITPPSGQTSPTHTSIIIWFSLQIWKLPLIDFTFTCSVIGSPANSTSPDDSCLPPIISRSEYVFSF